MALGFSIRRNWNIFLSRDAKPGHLDVLYGTKLISIILIVADHRVAVFLAATIFNYQDIEEELRGDARMFLPHGDLLVDSFFFIAGLVGTHLMLEIYSKRFINPLVLIIGRCVRIVPIYFFMIWMYASALIRLGSGIGWNYAIGQETLFCQENWWTNALFINNYVNPERMCMLQSWYLACDLHFFMGTVILIALTYKKPKLRKFILYVLLAIFSVIPAVITYFNNLSPSVIFYYSFLEHPRDDTVFLKTYIPSHTRAATYIIGVLCAEYLYKNQEKPKKHGPWASCILFLVSLAVMVSPMFYGGRLYIPGTKLNIIEASAFTSLRRVIWTLGCALMMYTFRFGAMGLIGHFLSSKTAYVLSKLTFGIYLVHFIAQIGFYAKVKIPHNFDTFQMFLLGLLDIVCSMILALILFLVLEQPLRGIFKELVFSSQKKFEEKMSREKDPEDGKLPEIIQNSHVIKNNEPIALQTIKL